MPDEFYCSKCDIISTSDVCPECGHQLSRVDAVDDFVLNEDEDEDNTYDPKLMKDDLDVDGFEDERDLVEAV